MRIYAHDIDALEGERRCTSLDELIAEARAPRAGQVSLRLTDLPPRCPVLAQSPGSPANRGGASTT